MKRYRLPTLLIIVLLCFTTGLVLAQDATPEPSRARPALVPCVEGENIPCVQNVEDIGPIVGTWRSYIRDDSGIHFGFTTYNQDGSVTITSNLQGEPTVVGTITFERGIAKVTPDVNAAGASNCVGAGIYEMRLIRMGDQLVAVTYYPRLTTSDVCFGRVGGYIQPMIYYSGTGKDLTALSTSSDALTQSLVPCLRLPRVCDIIVTKVDDINGFWKAYFPGGPEGMAFWRADEAGGTMMVGNGDDLSTLKEFFPGPPSPNNFNGAILLAGDATSSNDCLSSVDYLRVIQFGDQRVALMWTAVRDKCYERNASFSDAMIWASGQ